MVRLKGIILIFIVILITLGVILFQSNNSFSYDLTKDERIEEYNHLWDFLEENMSLYMKEAKTKGINLTEIKEEYKLLISESEDFNDYYSILNDFINEFNFIGHLQLIEPKEFNERKLMYDRFIDEFDNMDLPSEELKKYGKYNIEKFSKYFYDEESKERYYSIIKAKNLKIDTNIESNDILIETNSKTPNITIKEYKDENTIYIKYPDFNYIYGEANREYIIEKLNEFPYKKVVIDIYNNPGGDSSLWMDMVSLLSTEEEDYSFYDVYEGKEAVESLELYKEYFGSENLKELSEDKVIRESKNTIKVDNTIINKPEEIYIIQGNNQSASEEFCEFVNKTDWALTIGEKVGGSGQGEPNYYKLPISKLIINYNSSYPSDELGNPKVLDINPDIEMKYSENIINYILDRN